MGFRQTVRGVRPGDLSALQQQVSRKAEVFYGDTTPTAENAGDLWVDPGPDGDELKRAGAPGSAGWQLIRVIAEAIKAGAIDGETITGAMFRTSASGPRVQLGFDDLLALYTGHPDEMKPGLMLGQTAVDPAAGAWTRWERPTLNGSAYPIGAIELRSEGDGLPPRAVIAETMHDLQADRWRLRDLDGAVLLEYAGGVWTLGSAFQSRVDGRVRAVGDPVYAPAHSHPYAAATHNHDTAYAAAGHTHAIDDTGWVNMTLINGWTSFGGVFPAAAYRRRNGLVFLRGLVVPGTAIQLATLPAGSRPSDRRAFGVVTDNRTTGAQSAGTAHTHALNQTGARVDVLTDGTVRVNGLSQVENWVSLDGIVFPADA